jgi:hypothetical protein
VALNTTWEPNPRAPKGGTSHQALHFAQRRLGLGALRPRGQMHGRRAGVVDRLTVREAAGFRVAAVNNGVVRNVEQAGR